MTREFLTTMALVGFYAFGVGLGVRIRDVPMWAALAIGGFAGAAAYVIAIFLARSEAAK